MSLLLLTIGHTGAQGIIDFENGIYPPLAISTNSIPGGPATGLITGPVGSYYFGLFIAPSGTTDPALFTFTGDYATNMPIAGTIYGGYEPAVPGTAPYQTVCLLVRGWSANIGHDVSEVTAYLANPTFRAWYAQSPIATLPLGDPNGINPPPALFGDSRDPGFTQLPGFTFQIYPVVALRSGQLATNGFFSFEVTGPAGVACTVQSTTDFVHWSSLTSVVLTNSAATIQTSATNSGQQFYRAKFPSN